MKDVSIFIFFSFFRTLVVMTHTEVAAFGPLIAEITNFKSCTCSPFYICKTLREIDICSCERSSEDAISLHLKI